MADIKTVIRGLECCNGTAIFEAKCPTDCPYQMTQSLVEDCCERLIKDALTLLKEKNEGIVPIRSTTEQKKFADRIGIAVSEFWCGACHFNLVNRPKFCSNCGKKVKWEDD